MAKKNLLNMKSTNTTIGQMSFLERTASYGMAVYIVALLAILTWRGYIEPRATGDKEQSQIEVIPMEYETEFSEVITLPAGQKFIQLTYDRDNQLVIVTRSKRFDEGQENYRIFIGEKVYKIQEDFY